MTSHRDGERERKRENKGAARKREVSPDVQCKMQRTTAYISAGKVNSQSALRKEQRAMCSKYEQFQADINKIYIYNRVHLETLDSDAY